jgi:tRNA (guanine-N7-)-methyltransferase
MSDAQKRAFELHWPTYGLDYAGAPRDFDAVFGRHAERVLEIGFGNGEQLAFAAGNEPARDFIGVEVHPPGVGHLLRRAAELNLSNLRVIRHDAVEVLANQIGVGTLESVLVLFPDPWHKKRHHKRRLIQGEFAALAASRLRTGGTLQLATDWTPYAEAMLDVLNAVPGLRNCAGDGRFVPRNPGRIVTRFERRGERLGHAVHDLCYERTVDQSRR